MTEREMLIQMLNRLKVKWVYSLTNQNIIHVWHHACSVTIFEFDDNGTVIRIGS